MQLCTRLRAVRVYIDNYGVYVYICACGCVQFANRSLSGSCTAMERYEKIRLIGQGAFG